MGPDRVGQTIGGGGSYIVFSMVLSKIFRGGGPPGWCLQGRSVLFALGVWVSLILIISFQLLLCVIPCLPGFVVCVCLIAGSFIRWVSRHYHFYRVRFSKLHVCDGLICIIINNLG